MKETIRIDMKQLENLGYELLDPTAVLAELANEPQYTPTHVSQLSATDLDKFDTLSFAVPSAPITNQVAKPANSVNWNEEFRYLEASLSNGCIWSFDENKSEEVCLQTYRNLFNSALDHLKQQQPSKSAEEVLAEFDSWAGTPLDILSPYGDIDFNHNIYEDAFEVSVPVSIISQNEEIIVKANMPWVKANQFKNMNTLPSIDMKSVLSLLPVRVNSQEVKVSFVNGEFRLEAPRIETSSEPTVRNAKAH